MQRKRNKQTFSIRVTIGTLITFVATLTAAFALSIHYHFIYDTLEEHQLEDFSVVAETVTENLRETDERMHNIVSLLSNVIDPSQDSHHWLTAFVSILEATPDLYSVYFSTLDDEFYEVLNLNIDESMRESMGARLEDRWLIITDSWSDEKQRIRKLSFLDSELKVRKTKTLKSNYFPSARPWYQKALSAKGAVTKTEPYVFAQVTDSGQTYAVWNPRLNTVIGADILVSTLSSILNRTFENQISEAYVFRQTGELLADTTQTIKEERLPWLKALPMTEAEKALVTSFNPLRISNQRNWAPIDYVVLGEPRGYGIDVVKMVGQMTGIEWTYVNGFEWKEMINQFNDGKIDALHSVQRHKDGYVKGHFSDKVFSLPFGILVPEEFTHVQDLNEFNGGELAILGGWSIIPYLKKNYPSIQFVEVIDSYEAIGLIKLGKVDGFIDSTAILEYANNHYFTKDLSIIKNVAPLNREFETRYHIVLSDSYSELIPIINRAIANIGQSEQNLLLEKWLGDTVATKHRLIPHAVFYDLMNSPPEHGKLVKTETKLGETYVYLKPVGTSFPKEFLAITLPVSVLQDEVVHQVLFATGISAIFMLPILSLAWLSGTPISKAIQALKIETRKIQSQAYSSLQPVESRIREISQLSESVEELAEQLQTHEKQQDALLDSIVQIIARAIDDKSPYTAGHCNRVPVIASMLAEAAEAETSGSLANFNFNNEQEKREFQLAAWLHDCGKITVPEHIVDKGTKLEANYNRLHEIRMRFEVIRRDITLTGFEKKANGEPDIQVELWMNEQYARLHEEFEFIASLNIGDKLVSEEDKTRLKQIGSQTWTRYFDDRIGLSPVEKDRLSISHTEQTLLKDLPEHKIPRYHPPCYDFGIKMKAPEYLSDLGEVYNLSISRGTLTAEDRYRINEHMVSGIKMLESLPFPDELKQVARLATTHHETLAGTGYPRQLTADELSTKERILAIADIFEALTAADRPYKKAFKLSKAIAIMEEMVKNQHIDGELFSLFIKNNLHINYAKRFLNADQIDVEENTYTQVTSRY